MHVFAFLVVKHVDDAGELGVDDAVFEFYFEGAHIGPCDFEIEEPTVPGLGRADALVAHLVDALQFARGQLILCACLREGDEGGADVDTQEFLAGVDELALFDSLPLDLAECLGAEGDVFPGLDGAHQGEFVFEGGRLEDLDFDVHGSLFGDDTGVGGAGTQGHADDGDDDSRDDNASDHQEV